MAGVNKIILVGNLGKDPEFKELEGDNAMCKFSVATPRRWTDRQGNKQERTDWHNIVTWGKQAHNCFRYLAKGKLVYVEGRMERKEYKDKDGRPQYFHQVQAYKVQFLGGKADDDAPRTTGRTALVRDGGIEEELPF